MAARTSAREKILILDRGNVEMAYPKDWSVEPDPAGFIKLEDPTDSCRLEVSYLRLPSGLQGAPTPKEMLQSVLAGEGHSPSETPITVSTRGALCVAWADYGYECDDRERGERRKARGRWLLARNGLFQVLMTFYYWVDDGAWAIPTWERIIETLTLGSGVPLDSPKDHWSLRDPS